MIKKILKKIEKRGIKYCLSLLLVVGSVDFLLTRSWVCLLRAIEGIRNLALSFVCYFAFIFNRQTSIEPPVNKLPNIRIQDYLPFSIEEVLRKIDALPAVFLILTISKIILFLSLRI